MEVVVTSREIIKPSSPTPSHLRHMQLSFFDQINRRVFAPFIYFYSFGAEGDIKPTNLRRSEQLKKSLAETLTKFYPFAGRIKDDLYVDCNDDGVDYFEAKAKCKLLDLVKQQNHDEVNKLVPPYRDLLNDGGNQTLAIQVNFFDCGGMAIAMCFSHKIADSLSFFTFVDSWAAASRGDHSKLIHPRFDSAKLFPPIDMPSYHTDPNGTINKEKVVVRNFVFSDFAISAIRAKYAASASFDRGTRLTRVEALTGFIWSRFIIAATTGISQPGRRYVVFQSVNLRGKINPPLSESYFGNLLGVAMVRPSLETTKELGGEGDVEFVTQMRDAIRKVDGDYVKSFQRPGLQLNSLKEQPDESSEEEEVRFSFSSMPRYPLYETDFGWGRPIWLTPGKHDYKNVVVFYPTRSGDGIEVSIHLKEDDMAKLEADKEFLAFVSPSSGAKFQFLSSSL